MQNDFIAGFSEEMKRKSKLNKIQAMAKQNNFHHSFDHFIQRNAFRGTANFLADNLLRLLESYVNAKYPGSGISVHKIPDFGTEDDFSFTIVGNANYDEISQRRYMEKGKIYTDAYTRIIPSPYEESRAKTLLFRTSHGEEIPGDDFIPQLIQTYMDINSTFLSSSYESDVNSFIKNLNQLK